LDIQEPDEKELERIVKAHLNLDANLSQEANKLIKQFLDKRKDGELATDQLLNAIYLVTNEKSPTGTTKEKLIAEILKYLDS
jgi:hypothetical protein